MQLETPLTLPSPPRGEGIWSFPLRLSHSPNGDSFSGDGLLPLPLGERTEVRGIVCRNCIVTAKLCSSVFYRLPAFVFPPLQFSIPNFSKRDRHPSYLLSAYHFWRTDSAG